MSEGVYLVNEVFYTIHGEGVRYGTPHVFVRFAQCDMSCSFCDTEFESFEEMTAEQILNRATELTQLEPLSTKRVKDAVQHGQSTVERNPCRNVLFCGGEPLLQLNDLLVKAFKDAGWFVAVETNGTHPAPQGVDWITCSPKVAEHALGLDFAHELKYVRSYGQGIPRPRCKALHYLISPVFEGNRLDAKTVKWCVQLVRDNPQWRLTLQHHKTTFGGIR